jgi:hypothetical protein
LRCGKLVFGSWVWRLELMLKRHKKALKQVNK